MALNTAVEDVMNDRIDSIKRKRSYNFESVTRVKNELSNIVKVKVACTVSGNTVVRPADWKYTLGLEVVINGKKVEVDSMDMNEMVTHGRNSLMRGSQKRPKYTESDVIEVYFGGGTNTMTEAYLTYISIPTQISSGIALDNTAVLLIGQQYMVLSGSVTHDSNTYNSDDSFTATTNTFTGSGTIALLSNTNINSQLHNDICRRAAVILSGNVNNQDKVLGKTIESEQN